MLIRKGRGNGLVLILLAMIMLVAVTMMVEARDPKGYYKTLGVSNKATQQEIKQAYRKLSLSYHPDKSRNKPQAEQKTLQQQYMKILEAYETLSDEDKRRQYDRGGFDPFEHHHEGHSNHHDGGGSSFHFSFGDDSENDPFQDFPQFFKHHFRSQGEQGHPFFSFFGDDDDDDDDAPPFGFHFESSHSNDRRRNQKRRASSKSQETVKEEEGGFFSTIMGAIGDFYNGLMSLIEDSQPEEFQTVKKIITQINPDGSRTTRVVYEKVPINKNGKRTVFQF